MKQRPRPSLRTALYAGAALISLAAAPCAWAAAVDPFDGAEVIADADMKDMRGGFALPNGQQINFGAVVNTYANGVLALQTELNVTDAGAIVQQSLGQLGQSLASLSDDERHDLGLDNLGKAGVVIKDESGVTALVQNITNTGLQNVIYNTAAGRDLRQEIDVTITLPGFDAMQKSVGDQLLGMQIHDDIANAIAAAGR